MKIDATDLHFRTLNEKVRESGDREIIIENCMGHRYIGSGMDGVHIMVHGMPGNALGAYLNGADITVMGNAQDATGDTMNEGRIIADGTVTALRERLDRGAEITWIEGGAHHVHTTRSPERFVKGLDLDAVTGLTITRPTLEETCLSLVNKEPRS